MALELFTDYGTASKQSVTVRESGLVYISNSLLREYFDLDVDEANSYDIYVDREKKSVAILVLKNSEKDGTDKKFTPSQKTKSGVLVNAMPVLRALGLRDKGFHKADLDASRIEHEDKVLLTFCTSGISQK